MIKKAIIPALLILLTLVSSCKKSDTPASKAETKGISFSASSASDFTAYVEILNFKNEAFVTDRKQDTKSYNYTYTKTVSGEIIRISVTGTPGISVNATLKINGVVISPTVEKDNDGGRYVKAWETKIP